MLIHKMLCVFPLSLQTNSALINEHVSLTQTTKVLLLIFQFPCRRHELLHWIYLPVSFPEHLLPSKKGIFPYCNTADDSSKCQTILICFLCFSYCYPNILTTVLNNFRIIVVTRYPNSWTQPMPIMLVFLYDSPWITVITGQRFHDHLWTDFSPDTFDSVIRCEGETSLYYLIKYKLIQN